RFSGLVVVHNQRSTDTRSAGAKVGIVVHNQRSTDARSAGAKIGNHVGHKKLEEPQKGNPLLVPFPVSRGYLHACLASILYRVNRLTALPAFSAGLLRVARRDRGG
ncbi:MAG: hypothetical protein KJ000_22835, partial [Pirellulaceae bacterium]|nr:hypothetical protein [Pirellulaceae bacterium]